VNVLEALTDQARIKEAKQLLPLDPLRARVLGRLVRLAAELAQAPIALLTVVEGDRQVFAAHTGLPSDLASAGFTSIEYSICQYAVAKRRPLIVDDARTDPILHGNPAVLDLGLVAYAGIPLIVSEGHAVGTLCVVDLKPRDWLDDQLAQLALLADLVTDQFELQRHERAAAFRREWRGVPELTSRPSGW
jgi:GAF domain-containing protein